MRDDNGVVRFIAPYFRNRWAKAHPTKLFGWRIGGGNPGRRPGLNNDSGRYPVDFGEFVGKKHCLVKSNMI